MLSVFCMGGWTLLSKLGTTEISAPTMQFLYPFGWLPVALACLWVQAVQTGEKWPRSPLQHLNWAAWRHRGPCVFCGVPYRRKYFRHNGRHRNVSRSLLWSLPCSFCTRSLPGCMLWGWALRALPSCSFPYRHDFSDLVRTGRRCPDNVGNRRAFPEAVDQSSFRRNGATGAGSRDSSCWTRGFIRRNRF